MPRRLAAAVLLSGPPPTPPPGVHGDRYRAALAEDTADALHQLSGVVACLAVATPADAELARSIAWPGNPVIDVPADAPLVGTLDALGAAGFELAAVVAPDVPDLPGLLVGKLFSALEDVPVSVLPADGGGLVGLGARLPVVDWLRHHSPDFGDADALAALHAAAPVRSVVVGPGWYRLRAPADVARLDPRLEGWEATRRLLAGDG